MTNFLPIRGTSTQINNTPITDGQILFETNNPNGRNHIYIDVDSERIAMGISEWGQVLNKPFETIGYGLSVVDDVLSADYQEWSQILHKPFNSIGSGLTVVNGVLNANVITPSWNELLNRPFSSIGEGLTVDSNNRLNANIRSVTVAMNGSTGAYNTFENQRISVNTNGTTTNTEIVGTKCMQYSQTLSTTDNTVYTFSSSEITTNSAIDVFTSIWGVDPTYVNVSSGTCRVTFAPVETETSMICRIYIK